MLPYRDHNRSRSFPIITVLFLVINTLVWFYEVGLEMSGLLPDFINQWAVIPYNLTHSAAIPVYLTVFTAMFMHGSWMHFGSNMLYLWIFGDNVEDKLGKPLYIIFYFAAGIAATFAQVLASPNLAIPNLGASGAIAGVLGAYMIMYPKARIDTIALGRSTAIRSTTLPALHVLGFWFVLQLFNGVGSFASTQTGGGGVAYFAHIGGFVAGVIMIIVLKPKSFRLFR